MTKYSTSVGHFVDEVLEPLENPAGEAVQVFAYPRLKTPRTYSYRERNLFYHSHGPCYYLLRRRIEFPFGRPNSAG